MQLKNTTIKLKAQECRITELEKQKRCEDGDEYAARIAKRKGGDRSEAIDEQREQNLRQSGGGATTRIVVAGGEPVVVRREACGKERGDQS